MHEGRAAEVTIEGTDGDGTLAPVATQTLSPPPPPPLARARPRRAIHPDPVTAVDPPIPVDHGHIGVD